MNSMVPVSPNVSPTGVRYVDLRVAIPDNGNPYPVGYLQHSSPSKTMARTFCSPSPHDNNMKHFQATNSPYTFRPLTSNDGEQQQNFNDSYSGNALWCYSQESPYSNSYNHYLRPSPSPSMKSSVTATTVGESVSENHSMLCGTTNSTRMSPLGVSSPAWTRLSSPPVMRSARLYKGRNSAMMIPAPPLFRPSASPRGESSSIQNTNFDSHRHPDLTNANCNISSDGNESQNITSNCHGNNVHHQTINSNGNKKNEKEVDDSNDPVRKQKIKTELCMHYERSRECPFGDGCTYAHGEEELQLRNLMDLSRAGLIDIETYRTKPCLTWVTTGSCPFGKRCTNIHDPRISGNQPSWLPHTETQGNTSTTDINVESLHQKRLLDILHGTPFGDQFSLTSNFDQLYSLVCNDLNSKKCNKHDKKINGYQYQYHHPKRRFSCGGPGYNSTLATPSPIQKIDIALQMRGESPQWQYKYRPQHIIHDEYCMVLQKRAFRLANDRAVEIPISSCVNTNNVVVVREIAFGPDSDPTVRGVALWFNISEEDVTTVTPKEAKRYRLKRSPKPNSNNNSNSKNKNLSSCGKDDSSGNNRMDSNNTREKSTFDFLNCFLMYRPHDPDAYGLVTNILQHQFKVLEAENISIMKVRHQSLLSLEKAKEEVLKVSFESQRRHWISWAWPSNSSRENINDSTPVPSVHDYYLFKSDDTSCSGANGGGREINDTTHSTTGYERKNDLIKLGSSVRPVWESFLSCDWNDYTTTNSDGYGNGKGQNPNDNSTRSCSDNTNGRGRDDSAKNKTVEASLYNKHDSRSTKKKHRRRLLIFEKLARGEEICEDRVLPHIVFSKVFSNKSVSYSSMMDAQLHRQSEQCWRSLLLDYGSNYSSGAHRCNEWDIVFEHFEKARSKKTLSIVQQ